MPIQTAGSVRALALVGPTSAGKTTLMEALLQVTGAVDRRVGGDKVGDSSPEARARGHTVELNLAGFDFMGDRYSVIDCPGSLEFCADLDAALPAVDLAVVVAEPDPAKAALLQPTLRELERIGVPHALFINKMDQARGSLLRPAGRRWRRSAPCRLVARQIPTCGRREGHRLHRPRAGTGLRLSAERGPRRRSTSQASCAPPRPTPASICWSRSPTSTTNSSNNCSPM